ncbi:MAG: hypothetical protein NZ699_05660 [Roseiflexus sp.]|nr:hypothetical protein [Roseiflexus sp.]MDW8146494.1 hypothetical protein [Roseiflexaceae bacterium]MDW8231226.1 hypothetical protein [Roseiflexaceae bacterium]
MRLTPVYTHLIEIYTTSLVIVGAYDLVIYRRVSDAINGEQRRYITLRDAMIAPLGHAHPTQRLPQLLCDRSEAVLVAALAEAAPPPDYPLEEQRREVTPLMAVFFTTAFVVRGTYYVRPGWTLAEALERTPEDFLPLRNVQIFPIAGGPPITRDFAALAHSRIVALYQLAEPPAAKPSAPSETAGSARGLEEGLELQEPRTQN